MKQFLGPLAAALAMLASAQATAADEAPAAGVFPQGWYVAPMLSFTKAGGNRQAGNGEGAVVAFGHRSDIAAIELDGIYTKLRGSAKLEGASLNLMVGPFFQGEILSRMFGIVGFGLMREKGVPAEKQDTSTIFGEAGVGYMHPLPLWGLRSNLRTELRYRYDYQEPPQPAGSPSNFQDVVLLVGLQIPLSSEPVAPPPAAEPVQVVPPAEPAPAPVAPAPAPEPTPAITPDTSESDSNAVIETAKAGDTIVLHGVTFNTGKATLTSNAKTVLDDVAAKLSSRPELKVEIGGHTDNRGKASYNQHLSEKRAQSVLDYLVSKGVDAGRLSAQGYGLSQPVDSNDTDDGREHNRRVELKVLGADTPAPAAEPAPAH